MTPPGKSAALRLPPYEDEPSDGSSEVSFEAAIRNTATARAAARPLARTAPARSARDTLLAFPGFEPSRTQAPTAPEPVARPEPNGDAEFSGELEAALISDLQSMVALFDEVARDPVAQQAAPVVHSPAAESRQHEGEPLADAKPLPAIDPDQEALDRLLASIRQGDGAPRREALPAERPEPTFTIDELHADAPIEAEADAASWRRRDPASPRPGGRDERMAPPIPRSRKPSPAKSPSAKPVAAKPVARGKLASRAEPVPALRLDDTGTRRSYLKPAIAISALILLAAVGAGMTIRALTARNDTAPALAETTADAPAATAALAPVSSETSAAKTEAEALPPSATAPAAPASSLESAAPRLAVDNSLPGSDASPAPATAVQAAAAAPKPAPRVPLEPMVPASDPGPIDQASATVLPSTMTGATSDAADQGGDSAAAKPAEAQPKLASTGTNASWATGGLPAGPARIASGVKLRTNPDNGAPVIAVLAQGAAVDVVACKGWCEIVAGDKRGFVYEKFLAKAGG